MAAVTIIPPPIEARVESLERLVEVLRQRVADEQAGIERDLARKGTTYEASIVAAEKRLLALEDDMRGVLRGVLLGRQELPIDERVDALRSRIEDLNRRVADHERSIPALGQNLSARAHADHAGLAKRIDGIERRLRGVETEPCPNCNGTT